MMSVPSAAEHDSSPKLLLRELDHRFADGLETAIKVVSISAVRADGREVKQALGEVVELLQGFADVHKVLASPKGAGLVDAVAYLRTLGQALRRSLLDRMNIQLVLAPGSIAMEPVRCGRLGLIAHELVVNAARHSCFDGRAGEVKLKLTRVGTVMNLVVLDNGSRSRRLGAGRGLRLARDLARALNGEVERAVGPDFTSVVLSWNMTEREQRANLGIELRQGSLARQRKRFPSLMPAERPANLSRALPAFAMAQARAARLEAILEPQHDPLRELLATQRMDAK